MSGLRSDLKLLDSLIGHYLPNLKVHLTKQGIDLAPITMNWFLCLFVNTLPAEQSHRVLDCLHHEGPKVLFRAALAILHMREAELLGTQAVVDAYPILRAPFGSGPDEESESGRPTIDLLSSMYGLWLQGLSTDRVSHLREEHSRAVDLEDEAHAARREAWRQRQQQQQQQQHSQPPLTASPEPLPASAPQQSSAVASEVAAEPEEDSQHGATASGGVAVAGAETADAREEAERLRAESFALVGRLPVPRPSRLGFAERAPDDGPNAAASWLARVTGDEVATGAEERRGSALVGWRQAEESPSPRGMQA